MKRIALVGNFPPRKCGIATFTNDLNDGIKNNGIATSIIAMNDGVKKYNYPEDVEFEIEQDEVTSYIKAARFLNTRKFDAVMLQHEFGIFGGQDGGHIVQLLKRLQIPVVTTFHTVLDNPSKTQRNVVNEIADLSYKLVSISKKGIDILNDIYHIPTSKCEHIHHGAHPTDIKNIERIRQRIGTKNRKVLLTFGLLSRNKSIEVVIKALPEVVKKHPDILYIVLGATHPNVVKNDGEEYRHSLMRLAKKLNLEKNILFIDRFVSNKELFEFLTVCDVYIIPYLGQKQISSGTLIYAMGAGKPIISTPFWYAEEMLAENRGLLFDFNDSGQLSEKIIFLFDNDQQRHIISHNAFSLAKECFWPKIGKQYVELIDKMSDIPDLSQPQVSNSVGETFDLPPLRLDHLKSLTDSTGIFQHARYSVPNRAFGYCIDDNARALMLSVILQNGFRDNEDIKRLTSTYLSFIDYSYNPENGKFRNFMSYDRQWMEEEGSQDSIGRTMWALGYTVAHTNILNFHRHADYLFKKALENASSITHPRALSYFILGLVYYNNIYNDKEVKEILLEKVQQLSVHFDNTLDKNWLWYKEIITYGNSRITQALIAAGMYLKNNVLADRGIKILDWLIDKQFTENIFSPIGNQGWLKEDQKAIFDQQPLEAHGMIDACLQAEEYKKNGKYSDYALKAFSWFTGNNVCSAILYDSDTGGCYDGLHAEGVNLNQGAESTLSWLMSLVNVTNYLRNNRK